MTTGIVCDVLHGALRRASIELTSNFASGDFPENFSAAGWRFRNASLEFSEKELLSLHRMGCISPEALRASDVARLLLLCRELERMPVVEHAGFVEQLFRKGDNGERETLLRGLMILPDPARFLSTAIDACRAAVQSTFEAIACENAYPVSWFPPDAFRAMVLKTLHLGIAVSRVHGLHARCDNDLRRMAWDYASELQAAGKAIPVDIVIITGGEAA